MEWCRPTTNLRQNLNDDVRPVHSRSKQLTLSTLTSPNWAISSSPKHQRAQDIYAGTADASSIFALPPASRLITVRHTPLPANTSSAAPSVVLHSRQRPGCRCTSTHPVPVVRTDQLQTVSSVGSRLDQLMPSNVTLTWHTLGSRELTSTGIEPVLRPPRH